MRASLTLICSANDSFSTRASCRVAFCSANAFLLVASLRGAVGRPQLVESRLEGEELTDLVEIHAEHLTQLEDPLQVGEVFRRVAPLAPAVYSDGVSRPSSS